jgi:hypothetical protein
MAKKLQLTIAEPCHENWDGMTPVEKGKFCGSCQKQVVDFSDMSDRQVAEFFKKPSTGSVCGRFMTDQLDRPIEVPRKRIPWVKYFFQIALPAFLVSIKVSASKTQGEVKVNKISAKDTTRRPAHTNIKMMGLISRPLTFKPVIGDTIVVPTEKPVEMMMGDVDSVIDTAIVQPVCTIEKMGKISTGVQVIKNEIKGLVVDEYGKAVPFASIEKGKPGEAVIADENGFFNIEKNWLNNENGFIVSSTSFESCKVIKGEEVYKDGKLLVQLKSNIVLPEVVVSAIGITGSVRYTLGGVSYIKGQTISSIENKDNKGIKTTVDENRLFVFPNPVQSGATINLSFNKLEEGYYQVQLLNPSGQLVQQKEVWIDTEASLLNIEVAPAAAGSYFLVLKNKITGKKITEKILIL